MDGAIAIILAVVAVAGTILGTEIGSRRGRDEAHEAWLRSQRLDAWSGFLAAGGVAIAAGAVGDWIRDTNEYSGRIDILGPPHISDLGEALRAKGRAYLEAVSDEATKEAWAALDIAYDDFTKACGQVLHAGPDRDSKAKRTLVGHVPQNPSQVSPNSES